MHPPWVYMCSPSWTPLPPRSPYHPSGSSQCTSPKLPVSCIEPGLAIRFLYDIIHVLMPFSQIIPPTLSHRVKKIYLSLTGCPFWGVWSLCSLLMLSISVLSAIISHLSLLIFHSLIFFLMNLAKGFPILFIFQVKILSSIDFSIPYFISTLNFIILSANFDLISYFFCLLEV